MELRGCKLAVLQHKERVTPKAIQRPSGLPRPFQSAGHSQRTCPKPVGSQPQPRRTQGGAKPQTYWVREQVCCRAGLEGRARRHRGLFSSLKSSWSLPCQVLDMSGVHQHFLLPYFSPVQQEHLSYASVTPGLWKAGILLQFTSSQWTDCVSGRILRRVARLPDADGDYIQLWN